MGMRKSRKEKEKEVKDETMNFGFERRISNSKEKKKEMKIENIANLITLY